MKIDYEVLRKMAIVREICKEGHRIRQKAGIPVSQPLASITINTELN